MQPGLSTIQYENHITSTWSRGSRPSRETSSAYFLLILSAWLKCTNITTIVVVFIIGNNDLISVKQWFYDLISIKSVLNNNNLISIVKATSHEVCFAQQLLFSSPQTCWKSIDHTFYLFPLPPRYWSFNHRIVVYISAFHCLWVIIFYLLDPVRVNRSYFLSFPHS